LLHASTKGKKAAAFLRLLSAALVVLYLVPIMQGCSDPDPTKCGELCPGLCGTVDGCLCGPCYGTDRCIDHTCIPKAADCDDGNSVAWDGCTYGNLSEFLVNGAVELSGGPVVAGLTDGGFVVVWQSELPFYQGYYTCEPEMEAGKILARYFFPGTGEGEPIFQVNSTVGGLRRDPSVAVLPSGGFVVVWASTGAGAHEYFGVHARLFDSDRQPLCPDVEVCKGSEDGLAHAVPDRGPVVAALPNGGFVVVWEAWADAASHIHVRAFDEEGNAGDVEHKVGLTSAGPPESPDVAVLDDGTILVAWVAGISNEQVIDGQLIGPDGLKVGYPISLGYCISSFSCDVSVTASSQDEFVVVWKNSIESPQHSGIFLQRVTRTGQLSGDALTVEENPGSWGDLAGVVALDSGRALVVWEGGDDLDQRGVFMRLVDAGGVPLKDTVRVNRYTPGSQSHPAVAALSNGSGVVAWANDLLAGVDCTAPANGIFAQRFDADGNKAYR